MKTLNDVKLNKFYVVCDVISSKIPIKRRLLELGFTKGERVRVVRKSLLGKAALIELRGYTLTLKKEILFSIFVEE